MKKQVEFTPEFGVFMLILVISIFLLVGLGYYTYIRIRGMTVTSWWRSIEKNYSVGGVSNSLHLVGMAWDVVPVNDENAQILRNAGLRVIDEGDHLHAQIV